MLFSNVLRMPNRSEGHVVAAMPKVRLSGPVKFTYGVLMAVVVLGPVIVTISFIPYMRNKKEGVYKNQD